MKKLGDLRKIGIKKIKIFEHEKNPASGKNADNQKDLLSPPFRSFDEKACRIIDRDGQSKNENVNRDKGHIEYTTCRQEKKPAIAMGNPKIEKGDRWKKDQKR
jgi:hypothetical protein